MACSVFKQRPMTRREIAKLWTSNGSEYPFSRTDEAFLNEVVGALPGDGPIFSCGGPAAEVCPCGYLSDILCDFPIGRGKTCDMRLCPDCAQHIGEDRDLCAIHWSMFSKDNPLPHVFDKGPRLVRP